MVLDPAAGVAAAIWRLGLVPKLVLPVFSIRLWLWPQWWPEGLTGDCGLLEVFILVSGQLSSRVCSFPLAPFSHFFGPNARISGRRKDGLGASFLKGVEEPCVLRNPRCSLGRAPACSEKGVWQGGPMLGLTQLGHVCAEQSAGVQGTVWEWGCRANRHVQACSPPSHFFLQKSLEAGRGFRS